MRKFIMICIIQSLVCALCEAQPKMRDVFLQIPDSLLPYLTENNRLDFIDFIDSGMKAVVQNEFGGKSEMLLLNDESLALQVSPSMMICMRMMPVTDEIDGCRKVVCVIKTIGNDAPESSIELYSVQWNPVVVSEHLGLPREPYVAEFMEGTTAGLVLRQVVALDPIAYDEQKTVTPWLKNIEWKP